MIDLSPEIITVLLFGGVLVGVFVGWHFAFVVGGVSLIVGYLVFGERTIPILYQRMFSQIHNYTLVAVPLFIFMGYMMEYSGMTERLYDALYIWLGGMRGGLALLTMIIGIVIGGPIGVVAAAVSMLGAVGLRPMIKRNYDKAFAAGTVAAGGCLGILIPPSIMFIVYGPMAGISVGKLFFGAVMPGFLLSTLYLLYIVVRSWLEPSIGPPIPEEDRPKIPFLKKTWMLSVALVPPTLLIVAVLGVMFLGIAAPTEAAAIGASATTLLVIANRKFNFQILKKCSVETFRTVGFVFLIATIGYAFTGVFIRAGCDEVFANFITAAPGGKWGSFAIIMFLFLALGFFIDWLAMVYILVPVATQVAANVGFDPVWFAIMICINFQMEFMTPPMAIAIFIVYGSATPDLELGMGDCIRGIWPYVFLVIVSLALCIAFPEIITWLPAQMIRPFK
jgi:tripartite ATP-independent transporter DctM subunit